jgi:hypothetical protein
MEPLFNYRKIQESQTVSKAHLSIRIRSRKFDGEDPGGTAASESSRLITMLTNLPPTIALVVRATTASAIQRFSGSAEQM